MIVNHDVDSSGHVVEKEKLVAIENKLSIKTKLSYGLGDLASNLTLALTSTYLMFFYTDVYVLPVTALGAIFLISRIVSALFDPIMGYFVDKTKTKYGKARPYILYGSIPLSIATIIMFCTPDLSQNMKIAFAFFIYIIWGVLYSIINIPYGTMMSLMTHDSDEKMQLGSLRMLGMALGQAVVTMFMAPMVTFFGHNNARLGYSLSASIFAIFSFILFMIVFKNCKEKKYITKENVDSKNYEFNLKDKIRSAIGGVVEISKNLPWLVSVVIALTSFFRFGAIIPITIYFCNYSLKEPALVSVLLPITSLSPAVSALIAPYFFKKYGIRNGNIYAVIMGIITYSFIKYFEGQTSIFICLYSISMIFSMLPMVSMFTIIANSADYHHWKFGKRMDAQLYAWNSFMTKIGLALGAAFLAWGLAYIKYEPNNVNPSVSNCLSNTFYFCPIVIMFLQLIGIMFYRIDKVYKNIINDLKKNNINL